MIDESSKKQKSITMSLYDIMVVEFQDQTKKGNLIKKRNRKGKGKGLPMSSGGINNQTDPITTTLPVIMTHFNILLDASK